jgi:hypothetical protein
MSDILLFAGFISVLLLPACLICYFDRLDQPTDHESEWWWSIK